MADNLSLESLDFDEAGFLVDGPTWEQEPVGVQVGNRMTYDITQQFKAAAAELPIGQLVKHEEFTLFEAVGALEIMDPKMDSGYLAPGESLVESYNVMRPLSPEELIGIMDQLLCCEMAWLAGYPLAQTIFGCHYIDAIYLHSAEAKRLEDVTWRAKPAIATPTRGLSSPASLQTSEESFEHIILLHCCISIIKSCALGLDLITGAGHYYEEEDFSTQTFGRNFFPDISPEKCSELLLVDLDQASSYDRWTPDLKAAIIDRIYLGNAILLAMCSDLGYPTPSQRSPGQHWLIVTHALERVKTTHPLGKPLPDAFSDKIQRKLASTQPPRPLMHLSFTNATEELKQLALACIAVETIQDVQPTSAEQLKILLMSFNSRRPEPLPYPRACLIRNTLGETDEIYDIFLRKDLRELVLPASSVLDEVNWTVDAPVGEGVDPDPRYVTARGIDDFSAACIQRLGGYADIYRALLSNRCRLRRTTTHVIRVLNEIEQSEAPKLDALLTKAWHITGQPIRNWVHFHKLRAMILVVQLGFELDLYHPGESATMYWYLAEICSDEESECLQGVHASHMQRHLDMNPGNSTPLQRAEIAQALKFIQGETEYRLGTMNLAKAVALLFEILYEVGLVARPPDEHLEAEVQRKRYEARMKPFLGVHKPLLPGWAAMHAATHVLGKFRDKGSQVDQAELMAVLSQVRNLAIEAQQAFSKYKDMGHMTALARGSRALWEENVDGCVESALGVVDCTEVLVKTVQESSLDKAKVDLNARDRRHRWWIVPVLVA